MDKATTEWVVLNCFVTQILGRYSSYEEARAAADEFGRCSFPYELTGAEAAA
jgi:hypothetical protein